MQFHLTLFLCPIRLWLSTNLSAHTIRNWRAPNVVIIQMLLLENYVIIRFDIHTKMHFKSNTILCNRKINAQN